MELHFKAYEFGEPKYSELECRTRDLTYSKPLYVEVELRIKETGEIQRAAGLHGRLPDHDRPGHVHHQRRRARRGQPAGALARASTTPHRGRQPPAASSTAPRSSRTAVPGWSSRPPPGTCSTSRSTASASSRRPSCCAPSATRPTRRWSACSRGWTPVRPAYISSTLDKDTTEHAPGSAHRGLQEAAPGRSAHRRQRREAGREPVLQLPPLRPRPRRPLQVQQEAGSRSRSAWASSCRATQRTISSEDIAAIVGHLIELNNGPGQAG